MSNPTPVSRKYGNITFSQTNSDLKNVMTAKGGALADLSTASYGSVIREMFAAHADVLGFWTESAFNNSWLETATAQEAGYVGARSLGYSVRRAVPAKAGFNLQLTNTGAYSTVKVVIPKGTIFSVASNTMTAIDDVEFSYDRNVDTAQTGLFTLVSGRAILCEGVYKSVQFFSDGSQFQEFLVLDTTFSNWFGDQDPNYTEPDTMTNRIDRFTVITSDSGLVDNFTPVPGYEENVYWRIDRRGLVDPDSSTSINDLSVYSNDGNYTLNYSCCVSTANDGRVKIEFGDGVVAAVPYGQINVQYFSTRGTTGNLANIAGTTISPTGTAILITQADGTASDLTLGDLNFALTTDITGGLDIETLQSIQVNAPSVFNSLDSLGNRTSYSRYLSSISNVKYAIAFGEDILSRYSAGTTSLKYSNLVRFTCIKDLYLQNGSNYYVADPYAYMLEGYKVNGLVYLWDYDYSNLPDSTYIATMDNMIQTMRDRMVVDEIAISQNGNSVSFDSFFSTYVKSPSSSLVPNTVFSTNLRPIDFVVEGSELYNVLTSLNRKGYLTMGGGQHSYIPPTVHDMGMDIAITVYSGSNFSDIKTNVLNSIYAYLQSYTAFASPIYTSVIESIIQNLPETAGVNVSFKAMDNGYSGLDISSLTFLGTPTQKFIDSTIAISTGIPMTFTFDVAYNNINGTTTAAVPQTVPVMVTSVDLASVASGILGYYTSYIAYLDSTGAYQIKSGISEQNLVDFCAYIWSTAINAVYSSLYAQYTGYASNGDIQHKTMTMNLIESIKTWSMVNGNLSFVDNVYVSQLAETQNSLYNYINYIINYIKLVRDIIKPIIATGLIDSMGNITKYSNSHEIVQFHVATADFTVTYGSSNLQGNS